MIVTDLTERKLREEERAQLERERGSRAAAEEANLRAQAEIERRKRVEESLRQAEGQRTELLERERGARTEAEEANRLKDEFLATLSHELRSPLNAIVAWSHILRDPGLDPATTRRAVEVIDRNAKAQTQLVADLMDVSRIITGKFHMNLGPVRLSERDRIGGGHRATRRAGSGHRPRARRSIPRPVRCRVTRTGCSR